MSDSSLPHPTSAAKETVEADSSATQQGPSTPAELKPLFPPIATAWLKTIWSWIAKLWRVVALSIGSFVLVMIMLVILAFKMTGGVSSEAGNETHLSGSGADKIAVITLTGVVGGASGLFDNSSGISTESVRADLEQARQDSAVKAVILQINSPGGSAVTSDEIFDMVEEFKQATGKAVVASFGDTAASGGYYIGAAADKIVANPATITGSIGVIMEYYNASGLMEKIGVSSEVIKSGAMKDIGSFSRASTAEERSVLQSVVDGAYSQFVDRVAAGRMMDRARVVQLADGRIYTGSQAKDNGLVDELGNLDKAVNVAEGLASIKDASVVRYDHNGLWQSLLQGASQLSPLYALNQVAEQADSGLSGKLQYRWSL